MPLIETDLSPAEVLRLLYNRATCPGGMAALAYRPGNLARPVAERIVKDQTCEIGGNQQRCYVDYLKGRIIKTDVMDRPLNSRLYDRDHGPDAMLDALTSPE
jgi:hypothetical protein